ncbi:uncharacterized protein LOC142768780 isoform X3 [Rhipicephalus microplus]|uniref:uncharacterized protein LOC142768780 isoform X3 n=1 Tax=Rhipicephalus microplus TaxID=6941 RepID=UPI003F6C1747
MKHAHTGLIFCLSIQKVPEEHTFTTIQRKHVQWILVYDRESSAFSTLAEKICIGIRLCYAYASTRAKNSTTVLKQHIRNCMVKGSNFFYAESADQFFVSAEQLKRITEYLNHCMDDDMMDIDSSVQLGVIRYLLKSANLASPSL